MTGACCPPGTEAVVAKEAIAVHMPRQSGLDPYAWLARTFQGCDLVLVEGDAGAKACKVEVWRSDTAGDCLAATHSDIAAVITDDAPELPVPVWPRSDIREVADRLLALVAVLRS